MTLSHREALATILERVAEPGDELETVCLFDEVKQWPVDATARLVSDILLREAVLAESAVCRGCEEGCQRPITWLEVHGSPPAKPFSDCHLYPDFGPFEHSPVRLKRWRTSRELVVKFVGRLIGLKVRKHDDRWRCVDFADLVIDGTRRSFRIEFGGVPTARIGTSSLPLVDLFEWTSNGYRIDRDALRLLFTQSCDLQLGQKRYQASIAVREDKKLANQIRNRRLQRRMDELSLKHPKASKDQLARKIASGPEGQGMTAATIARVTRKPKKKSRRKSFA